jgi:hypothetical protein
VRRFGGASVSPAILCSGEAAKNRRPFLRQDKLDAGATKCLPVLPFRHKKAPLAVGATSL